MSRERAACREENFMETTSEARDPRTLSTELITEEILLADQTV